MNNYIETQIPVLELIPQRPPFVFVDRITDMVGDLIFKTEYTIKSESPLSDTTCFSEAGIMEFIAQSLGAQIGYISTGDIKIGVIGSVKNMHIYRIPLVGETIQGEMEITNRVLHVTFVCAKVFSNGELLADCELKVALQE